ncbi:MAG: hypothetical protein KBC62_03905 [Candidatus Pacebacteria bacterium]|nr:hypothetical protein [Candidatus Paceibacterota bacterium]MBP9843122.1 hypothetical protein [Candidatus Paceibacterota bacterium]
MPQEIITTRLAGLSPQYRSFIESDFITEVATSFGEASLFNERQTEILENALTFYLLFLMSEEETASFISRNCDMSLLDANILLSGILGTLPEGIDAMVRTQFLQMGSAPTAILASEIAETEKAFENIQGIRTMAADMREAQNQVPTYQSNQADIITPDIPPPPNNGPRWETDK